MATGEDFDRIADRTRSRYNMSSPPTVNAGPVNAGETKSRESPHAKDMYRHMDQDETPMGVYQRRESSAFDHVSPRRIIERPMPVYDPIPPYQFMMYESPTQQRPPPIIRSFVRGDDDKHYLQKQEEVNPEDSASNISAKSSKSLGQKTQIMSDHEYFAKLANIKRSSEIEERRRQLLRRRQEMEAQQDIERAKEELRLAQKKADEMRMRNELDEEEERLSCIEQTLNVYAPPPYMYRHAPSTHAASALNLSRDNKYVPSSDNMTHVLHKLVQQQKETALPKAEIDKFDGTDILSYATFKRNFKFVVEDNTGDAVRRLELLLKYTSGEARKLIDQCAMIDPPEAGYTRAKFLLDRDYGQTPLVAAAYRSKAEGWPRIPASDKDALRRYSVFITNLCSGKISNPELSTMDNYEFLRILASKLPTATQQRWIHAVGKLRDREMRSPSLEDFERFVGQIARDENDPRISGLGYQRGSRKSDRNMNDGPKNVFTTGIQSHKHKANEHQKGTETRSCTYCGPDSKHVILDCRKFRALSPSEKSQLCKEKKLCFGCLKSGHTKKQCKSLETCNTCSRRHPTALHREQPIIKQGNSNPAPATVVTGCVGTGNKAPSMTILPVLVKATSGSQHIATYAFLDSGCGAVFAAEELCNKLHTRNRKTKLIVKTLNSEETMNTKEVQDELQVGDLNGETFIDLPSVYVKDIMPVSDQDIPRQQDMKKWKHLQHIKLPDISNSQNCIPRVTLMIGSNVPAASQPIETVTSRIGEPYAIRSPLGWLIYGVISNDTREAVAVHFSKVSCCTSIQSNTENLKELYNEHMNKDSIQRRDEKLEELFTNYVNRDFSEKLSDETKPSVEDKMFLKIMQDSVEKEQDGHFKTALPFRNKDAVPNNRSQAEAYAKSLRKRLSKDSGLHEQYTEFMNNLETSGHAEQVPDTDLTHEDGRQWYIPHHAVFNPKKPDKIRVVYNCPASYSGVCLNKLLLQGPDLNNGLNGVLIRWRQEPIAVLADIQSMFYQVRVAEEDRDMLRYLWWPNGNLNEPLRDYRMCVHIFGAVSSPSCANYVLRKIAMDCQSTKPVVSDAILTSFYVDDLLRSFTSESEAVEVSKSIQETLKEGGFRLTKWLSNSRKVIKCFPAEDRAKDVKHLDLEVDTLPTERALGVQWNPETDHLEFSYNVHEKWSIITRRSLLSMISSIYDPLGMVAPFILKAKMILQSLCQQKIEWDDVIPQQEAQEWNRWIRELPKLEEVKLSRCMKSDVIKTPSKIQFHHFSDASEKGYGAVTYVRYYEEPEIHCAFVLAKTRVRPLKKISIPRLELSAAVTAVRVDSKLKSDWGSSEDAEIESHFWTDSTTVLKYIANESSRFHTFVANRVEEIRESTEVSQWHYVPTQDNPADDCSRGMTLTNLLKSDRWFKGPNFLWKASDEWPKLESSIPDTLSTNDPEIRKPRNAIPVNAVKCPPCRNGDGISALFQHYSSWTALRRAVGWLLRLKQILVQKAKGQESSEDYRSLTVEEMKRAEEAIVKYTQKQAFPQEFHNLPLEEVDGQVVNDDRQSQPQKKRISNLAHLDPVICQGIIRVGGRLRNADISVDAKHPVILPKDHHVTDLIIRYTHQKCNHQGRNHVLATLRQKYWILGAGVKLKQLVNRCVICRKQRRKLNQQMMADLPAQRIKADDPPFTYSGVDYFGPFEIKVGRSTVKRYGVLFTCLNSRAVHIEIADSMTTSSCINALRRFLARRGTVKEIISDNGSNFVGANRELHEAFKELDQNAIQRFALNQEISWKFNTPTASHHGGVWERMIRTVRKILQTMLNEQHLKVARSSEELHTLMCEVEATINSRPLTRASEDPSDYEVLTPNHLLQMSTPDHVPPGVFNPKDVYVRKRWRQIQYLADLFWKRWVAEYLPSLQKRQRWLHPLRNVTVGDLVLIADSGAPRNSWPMGIVEKVKVGSKGLVRSATVRTKTTVLDRPISKLCTLLEMES